MLQGDVLLYVRRASPAQINTCLSVAALIVIAFLLVIPFAARPLPRYSAFIPVVDALLLFSDAVTATILLVQAVILKSRALVALSLGYVFGGLLIIPHALTFPGAFAPSGLLGGDLHTTAWLYFFWHCSLPIAVIAYAVLRRADDRRGAQQSVTGLVFWGMPSVVAAALMLTFATIVGPGLLPPVMIDTIAWSTWNLTGFASVVALLLAISMTMVWRSDRSLFDHWLLVSLLAWMIDALLLPISAERYSLGWYSGRIAGLLAGLFVVLALLVETSRLYMQLALSAAAEQRNREGRLLSLDAATAAIAHEVKQPVAAMTTNAAAALIRLRKPEADKLKIERSLQAIVDDGYRVADVIGSIRALFGARAGETEHVDINGVVRDTLALLSVALASRRIDVRQDLAPDLPTLELQSRQIQQVLLNLLTNAIEAAAEAISPRHVSICTGEAENGSIAISVANTGHGIPPDQLERIFDAFFTTKAYGTGMGLPLCRSIVEAHGGSIWAASEPGLGATFHIRLPVAAG